jgi:hypothetical protein
MAAKFWLSGTKLKALAVIIYGVTRTIQIVDQALSASIRDLLKGDGVTLKMDYRGDLDELIADNPLSETSISISKQIPQDPSKIDEKSKTENGIFAWVPESLYEAGVILLLTNDALIGNQLNSDFRVVENGDIELAKIANTVSSKIPKKTTEQTTKTKDDKKTSTQKTKTNSSKSSNNSANPKLTPVAATGASAAQIATKAPNALSKKSDSPTLTPVAATGASAQQIATKSKDKSSSTSTTENVAPVSLSANFLAPKTLYDFAMAVVTLEEYNNTHQSALLVQIIEGKPPAILVVLPMTRGEGDQPNNWEQNYSAMQGSSSIVENLDKILEQVFKEQGITDFKEIPLMIAGFSQGGLNAGLFAQEYFGKYNIKQLLTLGAPLGRYYIPAEINTIAYEFEEDLVPQVDGKSNADTINTIRVPGGKNSTTNGYFPNEDGDQPHNLLKYTDAIKDYPPKNSNNLNTFLNGKARTTKLFELYTVSEQQ